jgi:transcriptional regulator with XRE-family HTH domain
MANETSFAAWLKGWLDRSDYTGESLGLAMGNTGAMVSKWVNGQSIPDAKNLLRLSEITGASHWFLASLAWGWPEVPTTDDLLKKPGARDLVGIWDDLDALDPALADDLAEVARALYKRARKRKGGG